jgi:hypothetical protein
VRGLQKKESGAYTAARAALGWRTYKTGQSRWFVGYKKHTLRLWLPTIHPSVTLLPLVSWVAPANVGDAGLLLPSLRWCHQHLGWWPGVVVADLNYLSADLKRTARTQWQTAIVTKLRKDMSLIAPYVSEKEIQCPQGQTLEWWEYEPESALQWFRASSDAPLCLYCWEAAHCPRHFGYPAAQHETLLGLLPLASHTTQRLLRQVRPWIEAAQSFEKNQLGLSQLFFRNLRLTWQLSLWADSAGLLRTMAWLDTPAQDHSLRELLGKQMELGLAD